MANPSLVLPGDARISLWSAVLVLTKIAVYGALFAFLRFGRWGMRMRAAGQNPLLAAQRGINLHAVYALAWSLSTLTGALAGILMALDSGIDQQHAGDRAQGLPGGAGRRPRQPRRRAGRRADHRRRRSAADLLRRSAACPTSCRSWCWSPCWSCGPGGCSARARSSTVFRPTRAPAAISAPTTHKISR